MGATIKSLVLAFGLVMTLAAPVWGTSNFAGEAEAGYRAARQAFSTNSNDFETALKLSIAAFDYAEFTHADNARESIAEVGIQSARQAVGLDGKSAAGHYYLALNIGQLARTKMWGGLKFIHEMEREFKRSIELDPKLDHAGAYRALGLLYMEAPAPPMSIGSKTKARAYLDRALELASNYPDNHLTYMEGLLKWKDREALAEKASAYEKLLPKAKMEFGGHVWEWEWTGWDKRWEVLQAKAKRK